MIEEGDTNSISFFYFRGILQTERFLSFFHQKNFLYSYFFNRVLLLSLWTLSKIVLLINGQGMRF